MSPIDPEEARPSHVQKEGEHVQKEGEPQLAGAATFLYEMGHLKHLPRAGWLLLGIRQPETVAEHSFRTGIVGIALAALEGADAGRTAALCLLHDAHETRIGDIHTVSRVYLNSATPEDVTSDQTAVMPVPMASAFHDLVAEFEGEVTLESRIAHDADKLEMLLQAMEYRAEGLDTSEWIDDSLGALRTGSARQLARAIASSDPHDWFSTVGVSHAESQAGAAHRRPESRARPGRDGRLG